MNRHEARLYIGQHVIIDEADSGEYVGVLEDVIAKTSSPWVGKVRIVGVLTYPTIYLDPTKFHDILYDSGEKVDIPGKRIKALENSFQQSFEESLAQSLKNRWDDVNEQNEQSERILSIIQQELRKIQAEHLIFEEAFVYYQLVKKGRKLYIYDEHKRESLSLDGCPFEFEVQLNGKWKTAYYLNGFTFETVQKRKVELKNGSTVRLNKGQFDPYRILINELESPSLIALERGLEQLGIGHENSVYCHNSLLIQLLNSFSQNYFSGVSFISYANEENQFLVQHHYERTMNDNEEDITFDRFEFTSDSGERILTSYDTQPSRD